MKKTLMILLAVLLACGVALAVSAEEVVAEAPLIQEETLQSQEVVDLDSLFGVQQATSMLPDSTSFMCIRGIACEDDFECGANGCCLSQECHCD